MRPIVFLFPHDRMDVGGNRAQVRFQEACSRFAPVTAACYGQPIDGWLHLDDILARPAKADAEPVFAIHWGPDIAMLLDRLRGRDVVYFAHSTGWGMQIAPTVPILCVSRNTQGYWGRHAPNNWIAHVPNVIDAPLPGNGGRRDIDVLVQTRKSSHYLRERLVPALRERCNLVLLDGWVDDLGAWMRRSRVYLYDSVEHWIGVGATEGFGLPPLEAMANGCVVFSSLNDALSDYLDPGFNCRKLRVHSLDYDLAEVLRAVREDRPQPPHAEFLKTYAAETVSQRLEGLFGEIERFFAQTRDIPADIADPWANSRPTALQRARRAIRLLAANG